MDDKRRTRTSKLLSLVLRHEPASAGLTLEPGGWVRVDDLLAGVARRGTPLSRAELDEVVAACPKQRFAFDADGEKIRANQGHSVEVDLQLAPRTPPDVLFHGTADRSLGSILADGIQRRARHHVHLSPTPDAARAVGGRHGRPVVLRVAAGAMHRDGVVFLRSDNGVWLVDEVPAKYLSVEASGAA